MNYHIVRANETIDKIADSYNLLKEEIIEINTHISNWDHLIPGTRLKLPEIPETLKDELDAVEPFIEDYYPKIDISKFQNNNIPNEDVIEAANFKTEDSNNNESIPKISKDKPKMTPYGYYYPYYPYIYPNGRKNGKYKGRG